MPVAARWGDRQHTADRLDPKLSLMLFNEGNHLPNRRSGSACAKYADAFLRIPLAWRSCLFPRSNAFSRARRSLVKPSRRRAHRRLGPLERTRRVACRVSGQASAQSPCGLRCHCHIQAAVREKDGPRVPANPPCILGGFLLVHRAHPLRVLLSGKPGAVQKSTKTVYLGMMSWSPFPLKSTMASCACPKVRAGDMRSMKRPWNSIPEKYLPRHLS